MAQRALLVTGEPARARVELVVRGVVQGVGFRVHAVAAARRHGVTGWVANERDGAVRCVAQGNPDDVRAFVEEVRRGPVAALVESVDEAWGPAGASFDGFAIRSGWHGGD